MSLHQIQTPSNRAAHAHEMQREDFLALASAIHRFHAAGAHAALAIVGARYGFERPVDLMDSRNSDS